MSSNFLKEIKNDNITFSFVLGSVGNLIGFFSNKNIILDQDFIDSEYSTQLVLSFINEGGITSFDPSTFILSSEVLFLFQTIISLKDKKSFLDTLKNNYVNLVKKIENDEYERNLDVITKNSLSINDLPYDETANSSFVIIRCIPIGFLYDDIESIVKKCIEIVSLTHQNGFSIVGGICCALITKLIYKKTKLNDIIQNVIKYLKEIDPILLKYKYGKFYSKCKNIYLDSLFLYLERTNIKSPALIYPNIRSDFYYRNFNNGNYYNYGDKADDGIIVSFDCLCDSVIDGKPSFEKLLYTGIIHLGESSLTGFLSSFWYGLYFGYTCDIPPNIFNNIENIDIILNISKQIKESI